MKLPTFEEYQVDVAFYTDSHDRFTKIYQLVSNQRITHCGVVFTNGESKYINMMNTGKGSRFIPYDKFMWILDRKYPEISKGIITVPVGLAPVSISQLDYYSNNRNLILSPFRENIIWWVVGRVISRTYLPTTCALATCQLLRLCGFNNKLHIEPHLLYKELKVGVDNYFGSS